MGIRETLNENPRLTTGVTAGIIGVALVWIIWSNLGGASPAAGGGKSFFTVDDGTTWFAEDARKIPPFDYQGKPAVLAHVYKCDGKTFVNHMERYTPEAKKKVEAALAKAGGEGTGGPGIDPTLLDAIEAAGKEYKSPGQKEWVKGNPSDPRVTQILTPKCANPGDAERVDP